MSGCGGRGGFALITTVLCLAGMLGMLGLAVDVGRMYIAKNEAQAYSDAAAIAAARELDGTAAGIHRARAAVAGSRNRWNLGSSEFADSAVEFGRSYPGGPWEAAPADPAGWRFVRVRPSVAVPLFFMPVIVAQNTSLVRAQSVAGQVLKTRFNEGLFPFSPFAHDAAGPHFGLVPGQLYTLRWAAAPQPGRNTCLGDDSPRVIDLALAGGGQERGYIEESSAETVHAAITHDHQTVTRAVGDAVVMNGSDRRLVLSAILARVNQDSDAESPTYARYEALGLGNGRRIVAAPVNTGNPKYTIVQVGAFFLLPASGYGTGADQPFCAEYLGPWVQGSRHRGSGEGAGAHVVRLVE